MMGTERWAELVALLRECQVTETQTANGVALMLGHSIESADDFERMAPTVEKLDALVAKWQSEDAARQGNAVQPGT